MSYLSTKPIFAARLKKIFLIKMLTNNKPIKLLFSKMQLLLNFLFLIGN